MKAILTILFVLFIGVVAQAQNNTKETKAEVITMSVVTFDAVANKEVIFETVTIERKTEVVRLYKFKNSRIKKALTFGTKKTKAKIA